MSHEDLGLGKIITTEQKRDAIHVALAPAVAGEQLSPAEHVGFDETGAAIGTNVVKFIGIVDPYLKDVVNIGETFWLFLYPNTVTGMRHHWQHPAFGNESPVNKAASETWLRNWCNNQNCPSYEDLVKIAMKEPLHDEEEYYGVGYRHNGDYITILGSDAYAEIPPEFWDHMEIVTGIKIPNNERATQFSCSC